MIIFYGLVGLLISEREKELKMTNALLEAHITELQEKLEKMNVQLQEREKVNTLEKANLSREIIAFKSKLSSTNAELQNIVYEKTEMKTVLDSCKGTGIFLLLLN